MVEFEKIDIGQVLSVLNSTPMYENPASLMEFLSEETLDKQMNEAGIDTSVLYALDAPIMPASNEYVASLCKKSPARRIGFASVNPLKENAVEIIENALKKLGLQGCKFHPPLQNFYPNDKRIFPLYSKLQELNVPVVFHTGTTPFGNLARLDRANPLLIDEVACEFPKLRIMLTHLGTLWDREAFMVVEKNKNVFIDTAAYLYEIPQLLTPELVERIGEDKIIFGTDYPTPLKKGLGHNMKSFVECINNLNLSDKIKQKIFSENFNKFLKG